MKLNNIQIKALAQEVLNKIPKTKQEFTKEQLVKYTKIVNEYNKLDKEYQAIINKMEAIKKDLNKSDLFSYLHHDYIKDIKKLEAYLKVTDKRPTLDEIIHKITLETVFETKENLTEFINNLVKQYSK